jgi:hypothetical protein
MGVSVMGDLNILFIECDENALAVVEEHTCFNILNVLLLTVIYLVILTHDIMELTALKSTQVFVFQQ